MDLRLLAEVLWRSRTLVLIGVGAAFGLALFSLVRPAVVDGRPTLVYRSPALYQSAVQLLVTQRGFPEGRSVEQRGFADPSRFAGLATLYAQLVMGNEEQLRIFGPTRPQNQGVIASALPAPGGTGGFLPILQITGVAPSRHGAMKLADRAATSFTAYLSRRQAATGVQKSDRVLLERVAGPLKPTVYLVRKPIRPIFVFMLVMMLTVAAAFIRENLRGRRGATAGQPGTLAGPEMQQETLAVAEMQGDTPAAAEISRRWGVGGQ
jgi:hypothetical protein